MHHRAQFIEITRFEPAVAVVLPGHFCRSADIVAPLD